MTNNLDPLPGWKTYIMSMAIVVGSFVGLFTGKLSPVEAFQWIGLGTGLAALRNGIKKAEK